MQLYQFNSNLITNTFESLYDELSKFKDHVEDQVHIALNLPQIETLKFLCMEV
jgi:hypothetical protein